MNARPEHMLAAWPAWRYFGRLIAFRPWLWAPNALSIVLLIVLETVPGLASRAFFDWLSAGMASYDTLWWLLALVAASTLGRVLFLVGCQLTNAPLIYTSAGLLQHNLLRRLLQLPAAVALPHSSGEALSRFRDDVEETANFLIPFNDLVAWATFAGIGIVVMLAINPAITLGVFLPLVAITGVVHAGRTRIETYRRAARNATAGVTGFLADILSATQTIQTAAAEERVVDRFRQLNRTRLETAIRDRIFDQVLQSVSRNTANVGAGVILLLAAQAIEAGTFTVGDFALFVFYLGWVGEFTAMFGMVLALYRQADVSFGRLHEILQGSLPRALVQHRHVFSLSDADARNGTESPRSGLIHAAGPLQLLEVTGLGYQFPASSRGIQGVNLRVERGECVIVTGRVGAGKTTLLRVLLGLLPHDTGSIRWNGERVDDPATFFVPPRSAYTPQVPRLFSDSLLSNLLLGRPLSESAADLDRALSMTQLEQDLLGLHDGLQSEVGPRGVTLSGGQIQRAAAARMLVRRSDLLVLDDLSSLDGPTENALWQRLREDRSTTILAASHRPAALTRADRIFVLRDGVVVDAGSLDELLDRCDELQQLWAGALTT